MFDGLNRYARLRKLCNLHLDFLMAPAESAEETKARRDRDLFLSSFSDSDFTYAVAMTYGLRACVIAERDKHMALRKNVAA